jgi:hypothetical protein
MALLVPVLIPVSLVAVAETVCMVAVVMAVTVPTMLAAPVMLEMHTEAVAVAVAVQTLALQVTAVLGPVELLSLRSSCKHEQVRTDY